MARQQRWRDNIFVLSSKLNILSIGQQFIVFGLLHYQKLNTTHVYLWNLYCFRLCTANWRKANKHFLSWISFVPCIYGIKQMSCLLSPTESWLMILKNDCVFRHSIFVIRISAKLEKANNSRNEIHSKPEQNLVTIRTTFPFIGIFNDEWCSMFQSFLLLAKLKLRISCHLS